MDGNGYNMGTMDLHSLIATAKANGASDLHLEPGLPAAMRIRGSLKAAGAPLPGKMLLEAAQELIGAEGWKVFLERRSYDLSQDDSGRALPDQCAANFARGGDGGAVVDGISGDGGEVESASRPEEIDRATPPD